MARPPWTPEQEARQRVMVVRNVLKLRDQLSAVKSELGFLTLSAGFDEEELAALRDAEGAVELAAGFLQGVWPVGRSLRK
jgi:hypothetical protein